MPDTRPETLTYQPGMSRQTSFELIKAVGVPLFVLAVALFTISNFASYGTRIICPMVGGMWAGGFIVALILPVERKQTLSQTMGMCFIYCASLIGLKIALSIASGASAEMIAASYDQPIPMAVGNALPGVLQNIMSITSFFVPGGYLIMLVRKVVQYKKTQDLQKEFTKVRGATNTGKGHTRRY